MTARFIAIAGNIGAGKSTMVGFLSKRYGLTPLYEPVDDNPYIADFYEDMKRWAFNSQIFYLSRKYALHLEAQKSEQRVILDRSIYEDAEIFVENLRRRRGITKRDYDTYMELYKTIRRELQPPDLLIYLRCSVRGVRRRIKKRGRESEMAIPLSYIQKLHTQYEEWFERYDLGPKAVIETDKLDYLRDIIHRIDLIEQIEDLLK
ncbi:MAG: deoxynucleoside kinase [Proteobacteria bacterium]|nr:deoxynucleoside kinase [Pseudomonadota bacterium]